MGSRVYYFENDPATEQRLAEHMRSVAMNEQLALTDTAMHSETRRQLTRRTVEPVHPFPHHNGVEINLHNGLELVYKYVSKNTLTKGFSPTEGFTFQVYIRFLTAASVTTCRRYRDVRACEMRLRCGGGGGGGDSGRMDRRRRAEARVGELRLHRVVSLPARS